MPSCASQIRKHECDIYWDKADVWAKIGDRVGWRTGLIFTDKHWKRYNEITFNLSAPIGHSKISQCKNECRLA
ncbi:MAG: hypothetical protein HC769_27160 [Cyanobacteria bacterium CRU_2_1]|nr:hypothetical protein [Cyanobacteria bacterium RU_5_0]NJR62182.1 hypothetical protein [Cyanobacteria bacterium CRU_2_1]